MTNRPIELLERSTIAIAFLIAGAAIARGDTIDVNGLVDLGLATVDASPADYGTTSDIFDGNTSTIYRSDSINPAFVQVTFASAWSVDRFRMWLSNGTGSPAYRWRVEAADNQVDMDSQSGTWAELVPWTDAFNNVMSEVVLGATHTALLFKVTIERYSGDQVWLHEWQIFGAPGNLAPGPQNLVVTPFHTTTHVSWEAVDDPAVAGYEVYRRTAAGAFPSSPVKRVLQRTDFTDSGLTPGETYIYKVVAISGAGMAVSEESTELGAVLDVDSGSYSTHKNMELLVAFYTGGYTTTQVAQMTAGLKKGMEFYWRTSAGRLNMDVTWMYIDAYPPGDSWASSAVLADLTSRGVQNNQYDLAYLVGQNLAGCLGGYVVFGSTCASLGTVCGVPYPGNDPNVDYTIAWTFTHEIHHALEAMENRTGPATPEVLFCHFPWAYPDPLGPTGWHMDWGSHYDGIAQTNREYGDSWMLFPAPYDQYIECVDLDGDQLPDDDARVWMDEARFGSDPALADTDDDGLDDLGEYSAYNFRGTDPLDPDTDGDGVNDGPDDQPLYDTARFIPMMSPAPVIDGTIESGWSVLANGYYFTQAPVEFQIVTYAGYDRDALYLAFESDQRLRFKISIDGSGQDGRFESPVRHTSGATDTYNSDNKANHIGDTWGDGNHIYTYHGATTVQVYGRSTIAGAEVASTIADGLYRTEVRIPRVLPGGAAYTWYPPDAPVVEGLTLDPGQLIGLNVTFSTLFGSDGSEFSGVWTCLFETHSYVDFTLQFAGDTDIDGDLDLVDFADFQRCFGGGGAVPPTDCAIMDFDGDDDVDLIDLGQFVEALDGPTG